MEQKLHVGVDVGSTTVKIVVMDDGKILELGTHDELMALGGWYHEQFISQQMNVKEVK